MTSRSTNERKGKATEETSPRKRKVTEEAPE